uniref:MATH domain-containing protein n=1 Tax=Fagus sylvatica TaxID=28930 RepID=A0A2N9EPW8_FAGSY
MNGSGHISLYIEMVETENLPLGWEVYVSFKLFLFDHIRDKYLTIEESADVNDRSIKRFHDMKTEWGFAKFLSLDTFNDVSHGYLVNDCCQFGVEVFVHERNDKQECVSMIKEPTTSTPRSWKIENFSTLDKESYSSAEFTVGDLQWKIKVYPKGNSNVKGKAISVFLCSCNCQCSELKLFAEFKLRIRDPMNSGDVERKGKQWFSNSSAEWGFQEFILLNDLYGASRRLLFNDTLIVVAEIKVMSTVKRFP